MQQRRDGRQSTGHRAPGCPTTSPLPFRFSTQRIGEVPRAGPYAAFLGSQYRSALDRFVGTATKGITKTLRDMTYTDHDPYVGIADDSYFVVPSASQLQPDLTLDRLDTPQVAAGAVRRRAARASSHRRPGDRSTKHQQSALSLLRIAASLPRLSTCRKNPSETRELYGSSLFGQSCLAARRLVEAGSRVVSVFWDEYGLAGSGWDTHWNHYPRMKEELAPGFDLGWYGLITDLDRRGLLDDTLVVCTSEHGRTPKINSGAGRRPRSLVAGLLVADRRRRHRPRQRRRRDRQARRRRGRPPGQPQGPAGHDVPPAGHRPAPADPRPPRPPAAAGRRR